jgi:predicted nucleic acid-binding protein
VTAPPYLDTGALAKWFFVEPKSDEFEKFVQKAGRGAVSTLTGLELRCLAYRRLRAGEIDQSYLTDAFSMLDRLVQDAILIVHPVEDTEFVEASSLLRRFGSELTVRTLDLLHLASARAARAEVFATADRRLALAAEKIGFDVVRFD